MEAAQAPVAEEGPDRRPRAIDQVWAQRFLIAVRCQNAAAERERSLRRIEKLNEPCREDYLQHRRAEIIKEMNKTNPVVTVASDEDTSSEP
jgi:hypothetical protein